ncbi:pleckstrin homology domain-containing family G member 4B-like [Musca vetustissima]|uniref:pleckstrin homology domain-containing family G member 4B-like n=1 Tax=Musca vetustissima TaxID=27455 RepID=UPI002AB734A0|nr:pleckstrin homology domain-containing family G member 4B-like [Musca vetustissima]
MATEISTNSMSQACMDSGGCSKDTPEDKEEANATDEPPKEIRTSIKFEEPIKEIEITTAVPESPTKESDNAVSSPTKELLLPERLERRKEIKRRKRPKTIASSQPSRDIRRNESLNENGAISKTRGKELTRQGVSFDAEPQRRRDSDALDDKRTNAISSRTDVPMVISKKLTPNEAEIKAKSEDLGTDVIKRPRHRHLSRQQSRDDQSIVLISEQVKERSDAVETIPEDISRHNKSLVIIKNGTYQIVDPAVDKYYSLKPDSGLSENQLPTEICPKGMEHIQNILEELIKTEESYVDSLWQGLNNYGKIFEQRDLVKGLKGKKYVLLGNIEQIAEFHRDEFLPMLLRNRNNLKQLFDEFQRYIEEDYFYAYVLYAMNNQRSLELCNDYKKFFKIVQAKCSDNLGINSFLLQPIQRVPRYSLLLKEFIKKLFDNYPMKPILDSCCRLDRKLQILLNAINKSEVINDVDCISETHEFNIFYQGKFRDVAEFSCHDYTLKRNYRSKLFIYEKCIIYTEVKRKQLVFRGRYPREHLGMTIQNKSFSLYYDRLRQQECEFAGEPALVRQWQDLIRAIINAYAVEERARLKELHNPDVVHRERRRPLNLSLFRDSNRFSVDSGISNN